MEEGRENEMKSPLVFKRLTLESLNDIYPYLKVFKGMSCDYTAGGLLMWIDYFKYEYCVYGGTLFVKSVAEDNLDHVAFAQPLGTMPLDEAVLLLAEYCKEQGYPLSFSAITEFNLEKFIDLQPVRVYPLKAWSDYVYTMEALSTLSGKKLGKKRNHCNRFVAENPDWTFEPIQTHNLDLVRECFAQVCEGASDAPMAQYERAQVWKVLDDLECYPFEAMCLKVGNKVIAFSIGEVLNNVLHVHIEKSLRDVNGSAEMINWQFARYISEKYPVVEWVNRQDDAGDEGLRKAKQSYYPAFLLRKYNVFF